MTSADLTPRQNWTREEIAALYELPLDQLFARALAVKAANWPDGKVQKSQLLSIKTGGCAENCGYCSQSASFKTGLKAEKLMPVEEVVDAARRAKANGADRFCMGAAWRSLKDRDLPKVAEMISAVKAEGLETCVTLGMLEEGQAEALKEAGLDYYNHNLDTSREYYSTVVTTRTFDDRIETLGRARQAGIKLCCGGILGMGESRSDRVGLIHELSLLSPHPESVPVNKLVPIEGTPLANSEELDTLELARAIAVCRIVFPKSWVRLSAGRETMSSEGQALCILAGANSIFVGDRLLTTANPAMDKDARLLESVGGSCATC
ncbi:biotin synthase [Hyphomonas polymorpha PS728]|uniref:Biotin synthase n=1 Tax=Hyphomonas polymorpha PS728 TaxID=1280954 RepID=A0A062VGL1_9PROT|nr:MULTISPECIES: biotin synthase BioB [Hyphomonas]AXE65906.1 biotin synthase BioB [Hyphomonas sp. CACIAM 19H1]KCZ98629.1 biotin synthase [Hyphomonas polymorpha PS728]